MRGNTKTKGQSARYLQKPQQCIKSSEQSTNTHNESGETSGVSDDRYRLLVDNAGEGIGVMQDGKLKFVNRKVLEISGYTEEEIFSIPFLQLIHPEDREMVGGIWVKRPVLSPSRFCRMNF